GKGVMLALVIGVPGLLLYAVSRALGLTVAINVSSLPDTWWRILVLLASAAVAGIVEEVIVVGYLVTRLRQLLWKPWAIVCASAVLRGSYHLYQGVPMALGNVVMGLLFSWYFMRKQRLGPLLAAHFILDATAFIGPEFLPDSWLAWVQGT